MTDKPNLSPIVEDFIQKSPAAWESFCAHHSAEGLGMIATLALLWALILTLGIFSGLIIQKAKTEDGKIGGVVLLAYACFWVLVLGIGTANKFPDALGKYVAPERDAAADVIKLAREARK